jgi:hypothetical protein
MFDRLQKWRAAPAVIVFRTARLIAIESVGRALAAR